MRIIIFAFLFIFLSLGCGHKIYKDPLIQLSKIESGSDFDNLIVHIHENYGDYRGLVESYLGSNAPMKYDGNVVIGDVAYDIALSQLIQLPDIYVWTDVLNGRSTIDYTSDFTYRNACDWSNKNKEKSLNELRISRVDKLIKIHKRLAIEKISLVDQINIETLKAYKIFLTSKKVDDSFLNNYKKYAKNLKLTIPDDFDADPFRVTRSSIGVGFYGMRSRMRQ